MKALIIISCIISLQVNAQKIKKEIKFTFNASEENSSDSLLDKIEIEGKILKVNTINISTHKETSEFLRINDNTYYCLQKDDSNKIIAEGKAIVEKLPFYKFKIPIFDTNGNPKEDYSINFYKLSKKGIWNEKITDSTSSFGKYLNNEKDSIWSYSKSINKNVSVLEKQILYKKK